MSDQSQGPGWWQASDLKWYPPDQVPGTGAGTGTDHGSAYGSDLDPNPFDATEAGWGTGGTTSPPAWGDAPPAAAPPPAWGGPAAAPSYPPPGSAPAYGVPGWSPYGAYATGPGLPSVNGLAVAAVVLGVIGLLTFFCFFITLPLSVAGLICGGIALSRIGNGLADPTSRGLALGGTITSGVAFVAGVIVLIAIMV